MANRQQNRRGDRQQQGRQQDRGGGNRRQAFNQGQPQTGRNRAPNYDEYSERSWAGNRESRDDETTFDYEGSRRNREEFGDSDFGESGTYDRSQRFESGRSESQFASEGQGSITEQEYGNRGGYGNQNQFEMAGNRNRENEGLLDGQWRGSNQMRDQSRQGQSRGQHAGKGPKGYRRSDERIMEDINEQLMRDGDIDPSEIEVQVQEGEVTLTGTVDTRQAKRLAEDIAEGITGVQEVFNQIRVRREEQQSETGGNSVRKNRQAAEKAGN
jgi:osmotically-inducible protein OsmY